MSTQIVRTAPTSAPRSAITGLLVSPFATDHLVLRSVFANLAGTLFGAANTEDALATLRLRPVPVVICATHFREAGWKVLLEQTNLLPQPPRCIVLSRMSDEYLIAEIQRCGAHSVLPSPVDPRDAEVAVQFAWHSWQREWSHAPMLTIG